MTHELRELHTLIQSSLANKISYSNGILLRKGATMEAPFEEKELFTYFAGNQFPFLELLCFRKY